MFKDLTGQKIGKLLILKRDLSKIKKVHWLAECECGRIVSKDTYGIKRDLQCGCEKHRKNLLNQKINNFIILRELDKNEYDKYHIPIHKRNNLYWECECICGNKVVYSSNRLCSNNAVKHCGCLRPQGKNHNLWKGYEDISGRYLHNLKTNAYRRKLDYSITDEYIWNLFIKQNKRCALSGRKIQFGKGKTGTASLDRKNNNIGYVEGNVQWVHKKINLIKMDLSEAEFIKLCQEVTHFQKQGTTSAKK